MHALNRAVTLVVHIDVHKNFVLIIIFSFLRSSIIIVIAVLFFVIKHKTSVLLGSYKFQQQTTRLHTVF